MQVYLAVLPVRKCKAVFHPGRNELLEPYPSCVNMRGAWRALHREGDGIAPFSELQNCPEAVESVKGFCFRMARQGSVEDMSQRDKKPADGKARIWAVTGDLPTALVCLQKPSEAVEEVQGTYLITADLGGD